MTTEGDNGAAALPHEEAHAPAIAFEGVGFTYDGAAFVLQDIDLRIGAGEFVCILGGNGSGKSTLAKHIDALLVPDAGTVRVLGHDTADAQATFLVRAAAGMVFQNPDDQLVASLVENDVAFGPENLGMPSGQLPKRVADALAAVGLEAMGARETAALSGGQKQRVAIAGVLAMDPDILILDEASAMLDPRGRADLMRVVEELHERGMTVVMITHSMAEAARSERVVVLDGGRIALDGAPADVLTDAARLEHLNLDAPFACKLSEQLRQLGVPVAVHLTEDDLEEELCRLLSRA